MMIKNGVLYCEDSIKIFTTKPSQAIEVETYISEKSGIHLTQFWEQYLRTTMIPNLQYSIQQNQLRYRYTDIIKGFDMPVQVKINGVLNWIQPTSAWKTLENNGKIKTLDVQQDFLINSSLIEKP